MVSNGDDSAARLLDMIVSVLHVWDDLIDHDHDIDDDDVNAAFTAALVHIPNNRFYRDHFDKLNPLLMSAINNWHVANLLEKTDDEEELRIAFISRSSYIDLITQVAYICGGNEAVVRFGPAIRKFAHSEGWEGYLDNLKVEREARASRARSEHVL